MISHYFLRLGFITYSATAQIVPLTRSEAKMGVRISIMASPVRLAGSDVFMAECPPIWIDFPSNITCSILTLHVILASRLPQRAAIPVPAEPRMGSLCKITLTIVHIVLCYRLCHLGAKAKSLIVRMNDKTMTAISVLVITVGCSDC